MDLANSDGVGVAWAHAGAVHWYKTTKVEPEHIHRLIHYWSNYPRLVHFRLATAGGTRSDLCHPFEVGPLANCRTQGSSKKVMIHNGHWNRWQEVHALLEAEDLLPDKGPWSDSRLAAFLAHLDPDWYQALGGRVATLDSEGKIERQGDWQVLRQGIAVSNRIWDYNSYRRGGYTGYKEWKGWEWSDEEWESYFKESKEREKKDAEEKAEWEAARKAKEAKERDERQRKAGTYHSQAAGKGHVSGAPDDSGRARNRVTGFQLSQGGAGGASTTPASNDGGSPVLGDSNAPGGRFGNGPGTRYLTGSVARGQVSEEPYYNSRDGKWYRYDNAAKAVVETAPPRSPGSIG